MNRISFIFKGLLCNFLKLQKVTKLRFFVFSYMIL